MECINTNEVCTKKSSTPNRPSDVVAIQPMWSTCILRHRCCAKTRRIATARKKSRLAEGARSMERIADFGNGMRQEYPTIGGLAICNQGTLQRRRGTGSHHRRGGNHHV